MKHIPLLALLLSLMLGLAACTKQPTLDASTPERLQASSEEIRKGLAGDELAKYNRAVTLIIASVLDPKDTLDLASQGTMPSKASVFKRLQPAFDGLNASEVIAKGTEAEAEVNAKILQWKQKRAALQVRYRAYEDAAASLRGVEVTAASLRNVPEVFPGMEANQVLLDLTITNHLKVPLTKAKFAVSLMPAGISNPWVTQPFAEAFKAPIAPEGTSQVTVGPITVSIPESYQGPVTLESAVVFERAEFIGRPPLALPQWTQFDVIELSKLEVAIDQIQNALNPAISAGPALAQEK